MRINGQWYRNVKDIPLDDLHTRQLLNLLAKTRHRDPFGEDIDSDGMWSRKNKAWLHGAIKAVLATREHIPNQEETREARRAKHKRGR